MPHFKNANNEVFWLDDGDDQEKWLPGCTPISDEEANALREANELAASSAMTYAEKRAAAYPSIIDQLDMMYHGGYEAWRTAIESVKNQFPKPAQ